MYFFISVVFIMLFVGIWTGLVYWKKNSIHKIKRYNIYLIVSLLVCGLLVLIFFFIGLATTV